MKEKIIVFRNLFILFIFILIVSHTNSCYSQIYNRQWTNYYLNDSCLFSITPIQMCKDNAGFIYVLCNKDSSSRHSIFSVKKYDPAGNRIWNVSYNSHINFNTTAFAIYCDANNNIYVGAKENSLGYLVVKYDSDGNFLWQFNRRANGNTIDTPYDMAVTDSGTVYITGKGYLSSNSTYSDLWTLKVSSSGNFIWEKYFNYPVNYQVYDAGGKIRLDANENIYIYGNLSGDRNICKYDSSGNLMWVGNQPMNLSPTSFAIDDSLNSYIAGVRSSEITIAKYDMNGTMVFEKSLPSPFWSYIWGITIVDDFIYAVGTYRKNSSEHDLILLKYAPDGDTIWTRRYDPGPDYNATGNKIIKGPNDEIICIGNSYDTLTGATIYVLKYDTAGNLLDSDTIGSSFPYIHNEVKDALSDTSGNLYVSLSSSEYGIVAGLAKLDINGNELWTDIDINYENNFDAAERMLIDNAGNLIVAGTTSSLFGASDIELIKYTNSGSLIWKKHLNYFPRNQLQVSMIKCDSLNNIYLCAKIDTVQTGYPSLLIVKTDSSGNVLWSDMQFGDDGSIEMDNAGNLYVFGSEGERNARHKITLLKYDNSGLLLWKKTIIDTAITTVSRSGSLKFDGANNFYATGTSKINIGENIVTMKLDTAGNLIWRQKYNGPVNGSDVSKMLMLDNDLHPVIVGYSDSLNHDYIVLKYDTSGQLLWHSRFAGPGNLADEPNDATIDRSNNIYVTGISLDANNVATCATIMVNPSGNILWNQICLGSIPTYPVAKGNAIAVDNSGRVIVAGEILDSLYKILTLVYDTTGTLIYEDRYRDPDGTAFTTANCVVSDMNASFYTCGQTSTFQNMTDFIVTKFTDFVLANNDIQAKNETISVYPNPFSENCTLTFKSEINSTGVLQVFDMMGKLNSETRIYISQGENTIFFNSTKIVPGTYFLTIKKSDGAFSCKIVVLEDN